MHVPRLLRHALIGAALAPLAACEPPSPPPQPAPSTPREAMVLDGVPIERDDIEAWLPYLRSSSPTTGRNASIRYLLDRHLVPLAFARRAFAVERKEQRRRADALAATLGDSAGVAELRELTKSFPGAEVLTGQLRAHLPIPEQQWLFADENIGRVSPVLETAQGFSIVAAKDKHPGLTLAFDTVDAVVVRFFTHKSKAHSTWMTDLRRRLGALPPERMRVHPDFEDAVPYWPKPGTGAAPHDAK